VNFVIVCVFLVKQRGDLGRRESNGCESATLVISLEVRDKS
jgi:hypothetical protein